MLDVSLGAAFLAGLLSFISPCVLPIVPPYLCYLAGVSVDELKGDTATAETGRRVILAAIAFVLGFSIVFVALGATASVIGQSIARYYDILSYVAGAIIIVMGLHFLGVFRVGLLFREARIHVERKPAGLVGAFVMGLAFAFGWTPASARFWRQSCSLPDRRTPPGTAPDCLRSMHLASVCLSSWRQHLPAGS